MRRSDGLKQVDAVFEKLYEQYDEEEIGALENDDDEITGFIKPESERVAQLIEEYERDLQKDKLTVEEMFKNKEIDLENLEEKANDAEELTKIFAEEKPKEKWDCESILCRKRARKSQTTLTLNPKTGLPEGVFRAPTLGPILSRLDRQNNNLDENAMDTSDRKTMASSRTSIKRSRFETVEEKKVRKAMVKAERKERRQEKKVNKLAFREEALRLKKQDANVKQNLTGIKLV
uniref:Protein LTV1 homolog n=1 Tax=Romanomermis culicivorax TaxID=13658 RepID=A0A915HY19_ROMCU